MALRDIIDDRIIRCTIQMWLFMIVALYGMLYVVRISSDASAIVECITNMV